MKKLESNFKATAAELSHEREKNKLLEKRIDHLVEREKKLVAALEYIWHECTKSNSIWLGEHARNALTNNKETSEKDGK